MGKNIVFFKPRINVVEGGLRVTVNVCNELAKSHNVILLSFFNESSPFNISDKVNYQFCAEKESRMRLVFFKLIKSIRKIVVNNRVDIIISETRLWLFVLWIATLGLGIKIVYHNHYSYNYFLKNELSSKGIKNKILNKINYFIEKRLDKIIVLTEKEKKVYMKEGFRLEQLTVIYNWVDCGMEDVDYNLTSTKIITVGRIDYQKGYEYLIDVAKMVFSKYPNWEWHIYGDGEPEYKNFLNDLLKNYKLHNNIKFMGNNSELSRKYKEYSFYVMTSRYEGLPLVLLEAKSSRLPIVSFDIESGPSDIIVDGYDGFLIRPFKVDDMAKRICELIENCKLRNCLSDNAYNNMKKFNKKTIIKQWNSFIEGL